MMRHHGDSPFVVSPRRAGRRLLATMALFLFAMTPAFGGTAYTSNLAGNWSVSTNWTPNGVPGAVAGDSVTINKAMVLDTSPVNELTSITINTGGGLQMGNSGTNRTLSVANLTMGGGSLTTITSANSTNTLNISGDVTLTSGTINLFTSSARNTSIVFVGVNKTTISGSGLTPTLASVEINKTNTSESLGVECTSTTWWANSSSATVFTNGFYIHNANMTWNVAHSATTIEVKVGLHIKQGTIQAFKVDSGTYFAIRESLEIDNGASLLIGDASGEEMFYSDRISNGTPSLITIHGGATLTVAGQIGVYVGASTCTWTQTGGTVTACTVGTNFDPVQFPNSGTTITMNESEGPAKFILQNTPAGKSFLWTPGSASVTAGVVQIGNASTANAQAFKIKCSIPLWNLEVNGDTAQATKPTLTLDTNALTVQNNVRIKAGTSLIANNLDITVGGNWTNDGTFTPGLANVTFNAASGTQTIGGLQNTSFYNLTLLNAATRQFGDGTTGSKTYSMTNSLTWNNGSVQVGQGGLTDTLQFNKAGATATVPSNATLTLVGTGSSFTLGTTVAAGVKINSTSTLSMSASSSQIVCPGNWTNDGTFSSGGGGGVTFSSSTTLTNASVAGTNNFGDVVISTSATVTIPTGGSRTSVYNIAGNFTNGGTFTHNLPSGGVATDTGATIGFNGTTTLSGSGTFNFYTVSMAASSTLTSSSGNINVAGNWSYGAASAVFNHNSGTVTFTTATTVSGTATTSFNHVIISGTLTGVSAGNFNVAGDWTNNGTFTHNSGTVTFNGSGSQAIKGTAATTFNNLTGSKSAGTLSLAGSSATMTVAGALSLSASNAGTFDADVASGSGPAMTVTGATTVSGGTLLFDNTRTTRFSGGVTVSAGTFRANSATIELGPTGLVVANGAMFSAGSTASPTLTSSSPPTQYPIYLKGSVDIFGLAVQNAKGVQLGTVATMAGNIEGGSDAPGDTAAATVSNSLDVSFSSSTNGLLVRNITNVTTAANPLVIRTADFAGSITNYNIKMETSPLKYIQVQNATGAKGSGPTPANGEANDSDPGDGNPLINGGDGYVTWMYFNWKWLGTTSSAWNLAGNWVWQGSGAAPETYPGATGPTANPNTDPIASKRSIWIPSAANPCVQNAQDYNIQDISVTTGGSLTGAAGRTLGIYGQAFKSTGGTFTHNSGTVSFAGTASQVVIIIGGSGSFYNLTIDKTGGATATLGADLSVANDVTVSAGSFSLSTYTLTQTGAGGTVTVSAGVTLTVGSGSGLTAAGAMSNAGQFTVSGGTASVGGAVTNTGTITMTSGSLTLSTASLTLAGTIDVSGGTLTCSGATITHSGGTLTLSGSATLRLGGVFTQTGGTFRSSGSSTVVTRSGASGYIGFRFTTAGTFDVTGLAISYLDTTGIYIDTPVTIANFSNVTLSSTDTTPTAYCIQVRRSSPWTATFSGIAFPTVMDKSVKIEDTGNDGLDNVVLTMSGYAPSDASTKGVDDTVGGSPDAHIQWNVVKTWAGRWKYKREILNLNTAPTTANSVVFVQLRTTTVAAPGLPATTPTASTIFSAVSSSNELRIVYYDGTTYTELPRDIGAFSNELIEIYFKRPVDFVAGHKAYLYYGAPGAGAAPTAGILTQDWTEDFELGLGSWSLYTGGGTVVTDAASAHSGSKGLHVNDTSNSDAAFAERTTAANNKGRIECWFKPIAGEAADVVGHGDDGASPPVGKYLMAVNYQHAPSDLLYSPDGGTNKVVVTPAAYSKWYRIYLDYDNGAKTYDIYIADDSVPTGEILRETGFAYWEGPNGILRTVRLGSVYLNAKNECYVDDVKIWKFSRDVVLRTGTVLGNTSGTDYFDISGLWNEPFNWLPNGSVYAVPGTTDEVVVQYNTQSFNYGPNLNVAATIKSLTLGSFGTNPGVNDTFTMTGTALTLDPGPFTMTGGKVSWTAGSVVTCKGDVTVTTPVSSGFAPTEAGNTFNMNGDVAQALNFGGSASNSFGTLNLYGDGGAAAKTVTLQGDLSAQVLNVGKAAGMTADTTLDVNGHTVTVQSTTTDPALTIQGTAGKKGILVLDASADKVKVTGAGLKVALDGTLTMSAGTIEVAKNWDDNVAGAIFAPTGGTVKFTSTGTTTERSGNNFNHVTVTAGTRTAGTALDINGNVTISGGTLAAGAFTHTIAGNFTNDGTFTANTSTMNFDAGSGTQTLDGASSTPFNSVTFSGGGTKTIQGSSTRTVNGTLSVTGTATLRLSGAAILALNFAGPHTVASGTTLEMAGTGAAAPTISFGAAGTLTVQGTFRTTTTTAAFKPTVTATVTGNTALVLDGATIDVTGLKYSKGGVNGLFVDNTSGAPTFTEFRDVDFTTTLAGGRHMKVRAAGGFKMGCPGCTFDSSFGAGANVRVERNGGSGDTVVSLLNFGGAGAGEASDEDVAPGYAEWYEGGDRLTASPGPGTEVRTDPSSFEGVQGFLTAQYNWFTFAFVGNYAVVRTSTDNDGDTFADDLLVKMDDKGKRLYTFSVPHAGAGDKGRVIGPPWAATIGTISPGEDVVMFVTTKGYIYVVKDTGAALTAYSTFPLRPRDSVTYATEVADTGYSPLLYYAGADFTGGTADDRFIFCGAYLGSNQIFVTKAFDAGAQAQSISGWPIGYGGRPSRSWPAFQFLGANTYLHIATDNDVDPDDGNPANNGHIFRVNFATGAVDQEYSPRPGNHVRGGLQMIDDPALPSDARIYVGSFEDAQAGDQPSFFAIKSDQAGPGTYVDAWAPSALGTGDVDSYANFDDAQVYAGDSAGVFYGLNRLTGATAWSTTLEASQPIRSSPVIPIYGGGPIYIGNDNGKVFAVNRTTGAVTRTYRLGEGRKVRSLSVVDNGTIYVVAITSDGYTFFFKVP